MVEVLAMQLHIRGVPSSCLGPVTSFLDVFIVFLRFSGRIFE